MEKVIRRKAVLKRHTGLAKRDKPIAKQSRTQASRHRRYLMAKEDYLRKYPDCQLMVVKECTGVATDIHHTEGKEGDLLFDQSKFLGGCRFCHVFVETHPAEAKQLKLSRSRLNKNNG